MFTFIVAPWIAMPAVGDELIPARQKSFGAVAPPAVVRGMGVPGSRVLMRVTTDHRVDRDDEYLARLQVGPRDPTTGLEPTNPSGWRGIVAFVVAESRTVARSWRYACHDATSR